MKMVLARPVITIMAGAARTSFVGVQIEYERGDFSMATQLLRELEEQAWAAAMADNIDWESPSTFMLGIVMPCGNRYLFRRAIDVPQETMLCGCGSPAHRVIEYVERQPAIVRQPIWP